MKFCCKNRGSGFSIRKSVTQRDIFNNASKLVEILSPLFNKQGIFLITIYTIELCGITVICRRDLIITVMI